MKTKQKKAEIIPIFSLEVLDKTFKKLKKRKKKNEMEDVNRIAKNILERMEVVKLLIERGLLEGENK